MRHLRGQFTRSGRWRRRSVLSVFLLVIALIVGVAYFAYPKRVGRMVAALLEQLSGAHVTIESVRFGLDGQVHLDHVTMRLPGVEGEAGRLFDAQNVLVRQSFWSLLRGRFEPQSLTFANPTFWMTEDTQNGGFLFEMLREGRDVDQTASLPETLPELFVRNGRVIFGQHDGAGYQELGSLELDGTLVQSPDTPWVYDFRLKPRQAQDDTQAVISGELNLKSQTVVTQAQHLTFKGSQRAVLPSKVRKWWDQLDPEGSLPTVRFDYDAQTHEVNAVVEVENASLTLPYGPAAYRMTNGSGRFTVSGQEVRIEQLRGTVEGVDYQIDGRIIGLTRDAPFALVLRVDKLSIPDDPGKLPAMPPKVVKEFARFNPSGDFSALVHVSREKQGERVKVDGVVSVKNARMVYSGFPYALQQVEGELRFTDELVEVTTLNCRGKTGGKVVIQGRIAPPGEGAAVHMDIEALDIPIDEALDEALSPEEKSVIDLFRDKEQYDRLVREGVIISPADRAAAADELREVKWKLDALPPDQQDDSRAALQRRIGELDLKLKAYPFEMGGLANLTITVDRPYGMDVHYNTRVVLSLDRLSLLYKNWPYPLRIRSGNIVIKRDVVEAHDIVAEGLTGIKGNLNGSVGLSHNSDQQDLNHVAHILPDLRIEADDVPVDDVLIASLPGPQGKVLRDMHVDGRFSARAHIFTGENSDADFVINIALADATARPFDGSYNLQDLKGDLTIKLGRLFINQLTATHGQSELGIKGDLGWVEGKPVLNLDTTGKALRFEDPLTDLVPPETDYAKTVRGFFDKHKPSGLFDASLKCELTPDGARIDLVTQPKDIAFDLNNARIKLHDITGSVGLSSKGVTLTDFSAGIGQCQLRAYGVVGLDPQSPAHLKLDIKGDFADDELRDALPESAKKLLDGIQLKGTFEIDHAQYERAQPTGEQPKPTTTIQGQASLTNARATLGLPVTQFTGDLAFNISRSENTGSTVDLRLDAPRLLVADRAVTSLKLHARSNPDKPSVIELADMTANCHGGTLIGEGSIDTAANGLFSAQLTLEDTSLAWLLNDITTSVETVDGADAQKPSPGSVTARVSLRGVPGDRNTWQGRGAVSVRDANMYELPLALSVLQVLNLTWPSARAFDRASTSFIVDGNKLHFDQVKFETPTIEIAGDGDLTLDTKQLDIKLYSRKLTGPDAGGLAEVFNVFKDELVCVEVTGTISNPKAHAVSFAGIRESWQKVFGTTPSPPEVKTPEVKPQEVKPQEVQSPGS